VGGVLLFGRSLQRKEWTMPVSKETNAEHSSGYGDKRAAASYCGLSVWRFTELANRGALPRGYPWTPGGKLIWSFAALDAAYAKARRSRKPKREPRGVIKQRAAARAAARHQQKI
jgi:hypothetical protein